MSRDPRGVKVVPVCHPRGCRSYVVVDPVSKEACVVDPVLDLLGDILRILREESAKLLWVVDTHSHADHVSGAAALRERTACDVVMHPAASGGVATVAPADGEILPIGEAVLRVHHAPGITADALVLEVPGALFTGDTLLIGTVGLRDAPGADARAWFDSLQRIFSDRDPATVLHPGHDDMGRTMTTLKHERTGNTWLRENDFDTFRERFEADDRPLREDAAEVLAANREGVTHLPADIAAASGLQDPAHATEAALKRTRAWEAPDDAPPPAPLGAARRWLLLGGAAVIVATLLGFLVHDVFHAFAGLAGVGLVGAALQGGGPRKRRRSAEPSLYYAGPTRKTIGE